MSIQPVAGQAKKANVHGKRIRGQVHQEGKLIEITVYIVEALFTSIIRTLI